jgi:uncharacterized protein DUF4055
VIEEKNKPNYKCKDHQDMAWDWEIVEDLSKGTRHLRSLGSKYLPVEPAEDRAKDYPVRLSRALLFNAFERTLNGLVGMVFRKEPKLGADVPEVVRGREAAEGRSKLEGWAENIDLKGAAWSVFAKEVFTDAMKLGHAFIYVDMPPKLPPGATRADELAAGVRPYWVGYRASDAVNWRSAMETRVVALSNGATILVPTGRQILQQITFEECSYEPDGEYGEKEVKRYRVLRPGFWELYRKTETETETGTDYILEAAGESSLSEIPVAVIYGRKTGHLVSKPPLLDLALINLGHYQKYSDYSEGLRMCIPQLCAKGVDVNHKFEVIGHNSFHIVRPDGDIWFAEPTGAGLEPQRLDLQDLEAQMARLGLAIMAPNAPRPEKTATEVFANHVETDSDLATAARSLKDGLELSLKFTTQYENPKATSGGSVEGLEIDQLTLTDREMEVYSGMQAAGQLSLETFWEILGRAGRLPENFDAKQEAGRVQKEAQAKADAMMRSLDRAAGSGDDDE